MVTEVCVCVEGPVTGPIFFMETKGNSFVEVGYKRGSSTKYLKKQVFHLESPVHSEQLEDSIRN